MLPSAVASFDPLGEAPEPETVEERFLAVFSKGAGTAVCCPGTSAFSTPCVGTPAKVNGRSFPAEANTGLGTTLLTGCFTCRALFDSCICAFNVATSICVETVVALLLGAVEGTR